MKKRPVILLAATLVLCLTLTPVRAMAEARDIMLGAFFTSDADVTDTIYASYDGQTFRAVSTPYRDSTPTSEADLAYEGNHRTHKCPGLCYYNGYYWMISNWNRYDGKFHPMLSYSKDLKTWTHPEGIYMLDGSKTSYEGVPLDSYPDAGGEQFDVVAPKMRVASDGNLYITFCAGYFSGFHGEEFGHDKMQVYTCRVTELTATDGTPAGDGYLWPHITFKTEPAKKVTSSAVSHDANANIIDSNLYAEDGVTYLGLKEDGFTEKIYRSTSPNDPNSWELVNGKASFGYEGVCITKANGTYYYFGDGLAPYQPLGIREVTSSSITRTDEWTDSMSTDGTKLHDIVFLGQGGQRMAARHGDVITLKVGSAQWSQVRDLMGTIQMYRLYNPYSGEHFYTASTGERDNLKSLGWHDEGVGWTAPATSSDPVYRLYNPYSGDHHYTMDAAERDNLESVGWNYEGVGWYSDEGHAVPVYRQFNPYAQIGTHNYTTNKSENDYLASIGWRAEGIDWYGLES